MLIFIHLINICYIPAIYKALSKNGGNLDIPYLIQCLLHFGREVGYSVWTYRDGYSLISFFGVL